MTEQHINSNRFFICDLVPNYYTCSDSYVLEIELKSKFYIILHCKNEYALSHQKKLWQQITNNFIN